MTPARADASQDGGTASPKLGGRFKVASGCGHSPNAVGRPTAVVSGGYLEVSEILDCGARQERDGLQQHFSRIDDALVESTERFERELGTAGRTAMGQKEATVFQANRAGMAVRQCAARADAELTETAEELS
mmetsp:Transcript_116282/g.213634  ORF Transcript_116282/g.213634 Transcript_116282/m.213634 type:complete len:132 (-) Transcript_116282:4-399(-)